MGSVFFWPPHAAWESNFAKVALKALGRGHFYFGAESSFFREIRNILSFSVPSFVFCYSRSRPNAKREKMQFYLRGVAKSRRMQDVPSETRTFLTLLAQRGNAIL